MFSIKKSHRIAICGCCTLSFCASFSVSAQSAKKPPMSQLSLSPAPGVSAESRVLSAPSEPAKIRLQDGMLTVEANNSNLNQILRNLVDISGMVIKGLDKGPSMFGVYGPASPQEVLSELLVASGYNFIMVGRDSNGLPRELLLAAEKDSNSGAMKSGENIEGSTTTHDESQKAEESASEPLGPGAIYPVPTQSSEDENVRSQQNLRRLRVIEQQRDNPAN